MLKRQESGKIPSRQGCRTGRAHHRSGASLTARKQGSLPLTRLPTLLQDLLGQARGVKLEVLRVLPGAQVEGASQLYRHGVEMTLTGRYQELLQYLAGWKRCRSGCFGGRGTCRSINIPTVRLRFQVHTLSAQRSLAFSFTPRKS